MSAESCQLADQMLDQVRDLSLNLRPPMLDDLRLVSALRWYVQRYAERSGIDVHLDVADFEVRLAPDLETTLFRVCRKP